MRHIRLMINQNVLDAWPAVTRYALANSTHFSVVTEQLRPYSADPPVCRHDALLEPIRGALARQELNAREWPGTKTSARHKVLNLYRIDRNVRKWFGTAPDLLRYEPDGLQDLCFYREDRVWFITVTHEGEIILADPTENDLQSFRDLLPGAAADP